MILRELFRRLSLGVLSNLAIGMDGSGDIIETGRAKIILHANEAMRKLYGRFRVLEKTLMIQTVEGKTQYEITPLYNFSAYPGSGVDYAYILDTLAEPYLGDLIRILTVIDEHGNDLILNDVANSCSLFTPKNNLIIIPDSFGGEFFSFTYQAFAPDIVYITDSEDNLNIDIPIPKILEDAFLNYIGHLIYSNMNTQESLGQAQKLLSNYENDVLGVEERDLLSISNSTTNTKFHDRGWI